MDSLLSIIPSEALVFLAAPFLAPPIFKRTSLGLIVGCLVAGIFICRSLLGIFGDRVRQNFPLARVPSSRARGCGRRLGCRAGRRGRGPSAGPLNAAAIAVVAGEGAAFGPGAA